MLDLSQLQNKQIVVLGLGLTGMSAVRFLSAHGLTFAVNDSRSNVVDFDVFKAKYPDVQIELGCWNECLISNADIIIASPGVDITSKYIADIINDNTLVWGDIELYCRVMKNYAVPMVAVTGSNGKSTVVSLLDHIGKKLGINTQLGGNVGVPVLETIETSENIPELLILELSSFQLETLSSMRAIAGCMLNLSDDHLDRHITLENYREIKQGIYKQCQTAIVNRDDENTSINEDINVANIVSFGSDKPENDQFGIATVNSQPCLMFGTQPLIPVHELPIAGIHNALNCLAALAIGKACHWPLEEMVAAIRDFAGLPHRCQVVPSNDGIYWINDSKATNVGATIAAINGLAPTLTDKQQLFLIAGGEGKGADFNPLQKPFEKHIAQLFTIGKDGEKLAKIHGNSEHLPTLEQAVIEARKAANKGDVVLMSPACASIDMFSNFVERGEAFTQAVQTFKEAS